MNDLTRYVRHLLSAVWPDLGKVPVSWRAKIADWGPPKGRDYKRRIDLDLWQEWDRMPPGDGPRVLFVWRREIASKRPEFVALIDARWLLMLLGTADKQEGWRRMLRYPLQALEWFVERFDAQVSGDTDGDE